MHKEQNTANKDLQPIVAQWLTEDGVAFQRTGDPIPQGLICQLK